MDQLRPADPLPPVYLRLSRSVHPVQVERGLGEVTYCATVPTQHVDIDVPFARYS